MTSRWVAALGALGLLVASASCGGDDGDAADGLPGPGTGPAIEYRLVYAVTTPEAASTEEHEVRRPFDAHVTVRNDAEEVTAERWSTLGHVITRSGGDAPAGLTVAAAPALSDSRFDRFADELVAAEKATKGRRHSVGGRACTDYSTTSLMGAVDDPAQASLEGATPLRAVVDRCVDAQGIVLEERWSSPGGERLLTKRAIELEVGGDLDLDLDPPDADELPAAQGNGTFTEVDDDAPGPAAEQFHLDPPSGFTHLGRYAVSPPRLRTTDGATQATLSLLTDVWVRGADLLLLDQGVGTGGATPFDPATVWRTVAVPAFGEVALAGDTRLAEVRVPRADGGFVRLAGTVPVDELLAIAATIELRAPLGP